MIAQASEVNDQPARNAVRVNRPKTSADGLTTYELFVIASQVDDVVRSAGGWLFDRVMAGWAVNVLVPDGCDVRALEILGVEPLPFETGVSSASGLAVAADVLSSDERVHECVVSALNRGRTEVTLWGERWPGALNHRFDNVAHRLSAAARAFKAQAYLAAAMTPETIDVEETFLSGARWYPQDDSDLMPVG
jgi:hypothetical protein